MLLAGIWPLPADLAAVGTPRFEILHGLGLGLDLIALPLCLLSLIAVLRSRRTGASRRADPS